MSDRAQGPSDSPAPEEEPVDTHITGQQALELLHGATPAPWWAMDYDHLWRSIGPIHGDSFSDPEIGDGYLAGSDEDIRLAAAAPALAETLVWLYGRDPETHHPDAGTWWEAKGHLITTTVIGVAIHSVGGETKVLSPDEAVDFARALLAAAEDARSASESDDS